MPVWGINTAVRNVRRAGWPVRLIRANIFARNRVPTQSRKRPATRSVKTWATKPVRKTVRSITMLAAVASAALMSSVLPVLAYRLAVIRLRNPAVRHNAKIRTAHLVRVAGSNIIRPAVHSSARATRSVIVVHVINMLPRAVGAVIEQNAVSVLQDAGIVILIVMIWR